MAAERAFPAGGRPGARRRRWGCRRSWRLPVPRLSARMLGWLPSSWSENEPLRR